MDSLPNKVLVICGNSAVLVWRAVREGRIAYPKPCTLPYPYTSIGSYRDLQSIDLSPLGVISTDRGILACCSACQVNVLDGKSMSPQELFHPTGMGLMPGSLAPLHLLVCSKNACKRSTVLIPHVLKGPLPPESFYQISDRLFVTSPALTFVQACLTKRVLPNIELGLEWCGLYALPAPGYLTIRKADPILSAAKLSAYLTSLRNLRGISAAREALLWLVDRLASPREAELFLMLVLPPKLGGFGLPIPQVNATISLAGTDAQKLTSDTRYVVDLLYDFGKGGAIRGLVIEYDGGADHEVLASDVRRDKEQRSVLAALGYVVIVISRQEVSDLELLQQKAEQIARVLDVRLPRFSKQQEVAHTALARWLFEPNHDHLPLGHGYH